MIMMDTRTTYYQHPKTLVHSCEDYSTGYVYRFWLEESTWMAELMRYPTSGVNEFDPVGWL